MRPTHLSHLAILICLGLASCGEAELLALDTISPGQRLRVDYVSRTESTLTDFEIDLAKLELRLSRGCRADHACAFGAQLAAVDDDLKQARSRLDELRLAAPTGWHDLQPGVDRAVLGLRDTLRCLR